MKKTMIDWDECCQKSFWSNTFSALRIHQIRWSNAVSDDDDDGGDGGDDNRSKSIQSNDRSPNWISIIACGSIFISVDLRFFPFSDLSKSLIIYNEAQKPIWMSHYLSGFVSIDNAATYPVFSGLIGLKVWPLFSFHQWPTKVRKESIGWNIWEIVFLQKYCGSFSSNNFVTLQHFEH